MILKLIGGYQHGKACIPPEPLHPMGGNAALRCCKHHSYPAVLQLGPVSCLQDFQHPSMCRRHQAEDMGQQNSQGPDSPRKATSAGSSL